MLKFKFKIEEEEEEEEKMSLYYNLIFGILIIELILFTIISLPLPSKFRFPLLNFINKPFKSIQFNAVIKCIMIFISILFIDSFNKTYSIEKELSEHGSSNYNPIDKLNINSKRFYNQRNLYLTGFTLFLNFIILRTYSLVNELIDLKKVVRNGYLTDKESSDYEKNLKSKIEEKTDKIKNLKIKAKKLSEDYDNL